MRTDPRGYARYLAGLETMPRDRVGSVACCEGEVVEHGYGGIAAEYAA